MKKFDFCVGNPAYQESQESTSDKPVYNDFLDEAYKIADKVEMITPARFLFNAGKTPKAWNKKMLSDEHLKILLYERDSSKVFRNTSINGGVVITYRDSLKRYDAITTFIQFNELNQIINKIKAKKTESLSSICYSSEICSLTDKLHEDYPDAEKQLSEGHKYSVVTNIFDKLQNVFIETKDNNSSYSRVLGRANNKRAYRYIKNEYFKGAPNHSFYKVFIPKSDGAAGTVGKPIPARVSGTPIIAYPGDGHTQTFMSIGCFKTFDEAENLFKYIKTKFARCLLGSLKVTQHNPPETWKYVPIQDFTPNSDIDWSKSIPEIDKQLYKKYDLSPEEMNFIETHVKEME